MLSGTVIVSLLCAAATKGNATTASTAKVIPKKWWYVFLSDNTKLNTFVNRSDHIEIEVQIYFQKAYNHKTNFKRTGIAVLVLMAIILFASPVQAQRGERITTIVIDAGHGGKDPGAVGKKSREKDVALSVALKMGKYITDSLKDVTVIYTRSKDVFVPLNTRASIANTNKADVFVSIHCNAAKNTKARGVETFVMGEHRNAANLAVAQRENQSILMEEDAEDNYDGFDPNSPESYIMFSLMQGEFKERSRQLANLVNEGLVRNVNSSDRGVQQAGFLVLYRTAMPSILVEIGFISNPEDEKYLVSAKGQDKIALSLYRAFKEYKKNYEAENQDTPQNVVVPEVQPEPEPKEEPTPKPEPTPEPKPDTASVVTDAEPDKTQFVPAAEVEEGVVFKVQFDNRSEFVPLTDTIFRNVKDVSCYEHNKVFKYTSGRFSSRAEAVEHQNFMRQNGYFDAFVVAFHNGKRISTAEAEKIIGKK